MNLAETLKARRKMLGLTQKDLSEISGISRATIVKYETGQHDPTQTIELLLNAMGLELCVRRRQRGTGDGAAITRKWR